MPDGHSGVASVTATTGHRVETPRHIPSSVSIVVGVEWWRGRPIPAMFHSDPISLCFTVPESL